MRTTRITLAVAIVLTTAASAMAQAGWGATPTWLSSPQSTGGTIWAPKVGVDAAGNAIALWTEPGPTPFGTGPTVRTARYAAATRQWSSPQTLSGDTRSAAAVNIAVDAAGNALALWTSNPISVSVTLGAARYDAASGLWTPVSIASQAFLNGAAVAMRAGGDAVVCWADAFAGLFCRRYSATTATWAAVDSLGGAPTGVDVALDAAGHIHAVWPAGVGTVQTARFDAGTAAWSAVSDLATGLPGPGQPGPRVAMNDAGDAVATWTRGAALEASIYPAAGSTWNAAATLSNVGLYNEAARAVVDAAGIATVAWTRTTSTARTLQVARYDPTAAAWSAAADLPDQGTSAYGPAGIDVDASGNVHVLWSQSLASPGIRVLAARYAVSTGHWTTATNLSALGQAAFNSDLAIEPNGSALAVWFQRAGSVSVPQALRWDATPAAPATTGVTPASTTLTVPFTPAAGTDPALAPSALEYSLDDGTTWTPRTPAGITSPLVVTGLTDGVPYALRLRAVNSAGAGAASPGLRLRSGTGTNPTDLRVVARIGQVVTFAWVAPAAGLIPTSYLLEGGVTTQQILASLPTGGAATQMTIAVPDGTFQVRVVAVYGAERLGASSFVPIAVNAGPTPASAFNLLGSTSGSTLALSWTNDWAGATTTGLRLLVTGAVTASIDLPVTESFTFSGVPPGTYGFSIAPLNGASAGGATSARSLTFPGTCGGAPNPPAAFSASTQGGTVFLDWIPPASGEAVTSYLVSVSGAYTGSFPLAARTLRAPVPPGSYTVAVAAVGPCGTSRATAPQTVVVP